MFLVVGSSGIYNKYKAQPLLLGRQHFIPHVRSLLCSHPQQLSLGKSGTDVKCERHLMSFVTKLMY